jgi:hypothetical protein
MFGWADAITDWAVGTVETFDPFMFEIADPFEATSKPETVRPVRVPTDVTFGCEGLVTTPATLAAATLPTRFDELMFEIPDPFEATSKPETVRPVRVPTDVMLGWAEAITLWAVGTVETFDPFMFEIPDPFPLKKELTTEFRFEIPETLRLVRVPTDVMLSCEGEVTTPATFALATLPTRFDELMFEIADPFEAMSKPFTVKPVRVPTDVMLGCEGAVTTPATLAAATFPTRFEELRFERPEPFPTYKLAKTELRFEIPKTFRVADPYTTAELTYRVETLRTSVTLAEPRTYRLDPTGGALRVPTDTPFWYATFPATVVHWDERMAMFEAFMTRPY